MNKLSHSSVSLYTQCSYCYYLKYIQGIRAKKQNSALFFGKALDDAFNILLLEKDLHKAKYQFEESWRKLKDTPMKFRKAEIDLELVENFNPAIKTDLEWWTLYYKGLLFIETYFYEVIPKIKEVITVQEHFSFTNQEGDQIYGTLDFIVRWEDGKVYLLDNKTSSYKYKKDDAKESPQLSLYHYAVSDKYKIDGIGYIVLNKNIKKSREKTCKKCANVFYSRHESCPLNKCGGDFDMKLNPSVEVTYIFDKVDPIIQDKVIQMFDDANTGISNGIFAKEHNKEFNKYGPHEYEGYTPDNPNFYKKEKKRESLP